MSLRPAVRPVGPIEIGEAVVLPRDGCFPLVADVRDARPLELLLAFRLLAYGEEWHPRIAVQRLDRFLEQADRRPIVREPRAGRQAAAAPSRLGAELRRLGARR